tara:strand:+ start:194 stop:1585 length:1392 start_codon:yes stop_codon:yes gene_type:complete
MKYDDSDVESIYSYGKTIVGKNLESIRNEGGHTSSELELKKEDKGKLGVFIQFYWYGKKRDNDKDRDFPKAKLELKTTGVHEKKKRWAIKEPLSICQINFDHLDKESWETSYVREKMSKMLIFFYRYEKNSDFMKTVIHDLMIFDIEKYENLLKSDWKVIHKKNKDGLAHLLSGKDTLYLATAPKGSNVEYTVKQPNNRKNLAKKLGYRLKASFVQTAWDNFKNPDNYNTLSKIKNIETDLKEIILSNLHKLKSDTINGLSKKYNISVPKSKDCIYQFLSKILGFKNLKLKILEVEAAGIAFKTVSANPKNFVPYEAMSFPAEKIMELEKQNWEESNLYNVLSNILLIIPTYRDKKKISIKDGEIGSAFFWRPSEKELNEIKKEWEMYRNEFINGKGKVEIINNREVLGITKASSTKYIHMRPHATKQQAKDCDSHGNYFCKHSFWLNIHYIKDILMNNQIDY